MDRELQLALADPESFPAYRNICAAAEKTGRADLIRLRDQMKSQIMQVGAYYDPKAREHAMEAKNQNLIQMAVKESLYGDRR